MLIAGGSWQIHLGRDHGNAFFPPVPDHRPAVGGVALVAYRDPDVARRSWHRDSDVEFRIASGGRRNGEHHW